MTIAFSHRSRSGKKFRVFLVAAGAPIGLFALLFAIANDVWVTINIPSVPWSPEPSWAAFEALLWAVMLVCLLAGMLISGLVAILGSQHQRRTTASVESKLAQS